MTNMSSFLIHIAKVPSDKGKRKFAFEDPERPEVTWLLKIARSHQLDSENAVWRVMIEKSHPESIRVHLRTVSSGSNLRRSGRLLCRLEW